MQNNADSNENRVNDTVLNSGLNNKNVSTKTTTEERLENLEKQTQRMSEELAEMKSDIKANNREIQYAINKIYGIRDTNGLSDMYVPDK